MLENIMRHQYGAHLVDWVALTIAIAITIWLSRGVPKNRGLLMVEIVVGCLGMLLLFGGNIYSLLKVVVAIMLVVLLVRRYERLLRVLVLAVFLSGFAVPAQAQPRFHADFFWGGAGPSTGRLGNFELMLGGAHVTFVTIGPVDIGVGGGVGQSNFSNKERAEWRRLGIDNSYTTSGFVSAPVSFPVWERSIYLNIAPVWNFTRRKPSIMAGISIAPW